MIIKKSDRNRSISEDYSQMRQGRADPRLLGLILIILLLGSLVLGLMFGAANLPLADVWAVLDYKIGGPEPNPTALKIVWGLRFPRTILAVVVGGGLSVAGAAMQTLVRNPLADPYLLGISSGASVGATAVITLGVGVVGGLSLTGAAFVGALVSTLLVFGITQAQGGITPLRMILTGTVLAAMMSSISSLLVFLSGDPSAAQSAMFWLLGTLGRAKWDNIWITVIATVILTIAFMLLSAWMDALSNGADVAAGLGVPVAKLRIIIFILQAALVGVLVASAGGIGFVGLVVPHITRLMVGPAHHRLFPLSMMIGAIFMIWVDVFSRVVVAPKELPLSVMTGIVGAPIFLMLLGRRGYSFGAKE